MLTTYLQEILPSGEEGLSDRLPAYGPYRTRYLVHNVCSVTTAEWVVLRAFHYICYNWA